MNMLPDRLLTPRARQLLLIARLACHGRHLDWPETRSEWPRSEAGTSELLKRADDEDLLSLTVRGLDASDDFDARWIAPQWRQRVEERRKWSQFRLRLLFRILDGMRAAGIRAATIKGHVLSQELYGDPHLRDHHDLDLVVATEQAHLAACWLAEEGFTPPCDTGWFRRRMFLDSLREATFTSLQGSLEIDLHWRIDQRWNPRLVDVADVLQTCGTIRLETRPGTHREIDAPAPPTRHLLVTANVIGGWECELRSLVDVARSARLLSEPDIEKVFLRAEKGRTAACLSAIMNAAHAVTASIPTTVLERFGARVSYWRRRGSNQAAIRLIKDTLTSPVKSTARPQPPFARGIRGRASYLRARFRASLADFLGGAPHFGSETQTIARALARKFFDRRR